MEEKYYAPAVSDMYLGYEYQQCHNDYEDIWTDEKVDKNWSPKDAETSIEHGGLIRTRYLSKEDIEGEGWTFVNGVPVWFENTDEDKVIDGYDLTVTENLWYDLVNIQDHIWMIQKRWYRNSVGQSCEQLYKGECRSINELHKLMIWLGIK